jgi:LPXTG-motif cell wall-anchored protein
MKRKMKLKHIWAPLAGALAISIGGATPAFAIDPSPAVMNLTGTPQLGQYMTVAFASGQNPVGDAFKISTCPDKNVLPVDSYLPQGNCVEIGTWYRGDVTGFPGGNPQTTALGMRWLLADENVPGLNPSNDQPYPMNDPTSLLISPPVGGWCAYEGWYIIVNDHDSGFLGGTGGHGHSNWSEAFSCASSAGGDSDTGTGTLPDTGASSTAGIVAGSLGLAAIAGGLLLVRARRLRANGN